MVLFQTIGPNEKNLYMRFGLKTSKQKEKKNDSYNVGIDFIMKACLLYVWQTTRCDVIASRQVPAGRKALKAGILSTCVPEGFFSCNIDAGWVGSSCVHDGGGAST